MKHLYIFTETSRAANYGIGTYIDQLILSLTKNKIKIRIHIIHLHSTYKEEFSIYKKNGVEYINIPSANHNLSHSKKNANELYYENAFYLISSIIDPKNELIFHFNFMNSEELIRSLRERFRCKIILTVHYMSWSFELKGNVEKLKKILKKAVTRDEKVIKDNFEKENRIINYCDKIIAIANHSYSTLISIYKIPDEKIVYIPHGLADKNIYHSEREIYQLRKKFHISQKEIIVLFVGRIDPIKGVDILIETFKSLLRNQKNIRLLIVGDGNLMAIFKNTYPHYTKITLTGFVDKEQLYELYSISDIGVLPSLHEEFGYVALEMMMMQLPLIVSNTTGLSELVTDDINGLTFDIETNNKENSYYIKELKSKLIELIKNKNLREKYGFNGRSKYLEKYELSLFVKSMSHLYNNI